MAGKSAWNLLLLYMKVKKMKQLVYFIEQIAVVEGESDKKQGKRNMLFLKLSENIAHSLGHEGKRFALTDRGIVSVFFNIRRSVIATEIKIFLTFPFYDDLIGFNVTHRSFLFYSLTEKDFPFQFI